MFLFAVIKKSVPDVKEKVTVSKKCFLNNVYADNIQGANQNMQRYIIVQQAEQNLKIFQAVFRYLRLTLIFQVIVNSAHGILIRATGFSTLFNQSNTPKEVVVGNASLGSYWCSCKFFFKEG